MNELLKKCRENAVTFTFEPLVDDVNHNINGTAMVTFRSKRVKSGMYGYSQRYILDERILNQVDDPLEAVLLEYLKQFLRSAAKYEKEPVTWQNWGEYELHKS